MYFGEVTKLPKMEIVRKKFCHNSLFLYRTITITEVLQEDSRCPADGGQIREKKEIGARSRAMEESVEYLEREVAGSGRRRCKVEAWIESRGDGRRRY